MGKNTIYRANKGLAEQLLLAMNPSVVSASYDFLTAGTAYDVRNDISRGVKVNEPK